MELRHLLLLTEALLKGLVLIAVATALVQLLRQCSARVRAAVWSTALIGSLLLPLAGRLLPAWQLPQWSLPGPAAVVSEPGPVLPIVAPFGATAQLAAADESMAEQPGPVASAPHSGRLPALSWTAPVLVIWTLGLVLLLLWQLTGVVRLYRLHRRARPVTDGLIAAAFDRTARQVGVRQAVGLVLSHEVSTPVTWGVLRPVIALPIAAEAWLLERLEVVLQHELIHIRRRHWLQRLLARLACSLYWCNPLTWLALRGLVREQELACDEEVVALGSRPSTYAGHLLNIAQASSSRLLLAGAAIDLAQPTQLEGRIMAILAKKKVPKRQLLLAMPAIFLVALLVPTIAAVQPFTESGSTPGEPDRVADQGELKEVIRELAQVEVEVEPLVERFAALEVELEPELEALELDMEPLDTEVDEIMARMEPYLEQISEIEVEMEPILAQIDAATEGIDGNELDIGELDESLAVLHEQLAPLHEQLGSLHEQLAPLHEHLAPLHAEVQGLHEALQPKLARLSQLHELMAPYHEHLAALHEELQPFHEKMERLGERLDNELQQELTQVLASHLGPVTSPGAPFAEAAERILADASISIDEQGLTLQASRREVQEVLSELMTPVKSANVSAADLATAIERATEAVSRFEIVTD